MQLSKKSWHFRLHLLLHGEYAKVPNNFCPYFWKTIVLGSIGFIPLIIIAFPAMIISWIYRNSDHDVPSVKEDGLWSSFLFFSFLIYLALTLLFFMGYMFFDGRETSIVVGGIGWALLAFGIFMFLRERWKERRRKKRLLEARNMPAVPYVEEEEKPNVFVEGIKAWYKRNCPIIKWKE